MATPGFTDSIFQSTLPLRGVTRRLLSGWNFQYISIHTPLAGSDYQTMRRVQCHLNFNPHSPCGE